MKEHGRVDLCVIGAGAAGLTAAALAAQLGARVAVIERGGDRSLLAGARLQALRTSADAAEAARRAERVGVRVAAPEVDWSTVRQHVDGVAAGLAPNLSMARLEALGATLIRGEARFIAPDEVAAGGEVVRARRFVIATGAAPVIPPFPGIETVPLLTDVAAVALDDIPEGLIVLGGDPQGMALAQAFRRLGARVAIVAPDGILPVEDSECVELLRSSFRRDGIALVEGAEVRLIEQRGSAIVVTAETRTERDRIEGTHLLVAMGRRPDVTSLGLDVAGIEATAGGITVDAMLRTTNPKVYAIGDCIGGLPSATAAADHAALVVRNALLRVSGKIAPATPRVIATDPEIAQVGLTESEARRSLKELTILRWPFAENDRARAERDFEGFVKVVGNRRGEILGVSVVGRGAGDVIAPWALAMKHGLTIRDVGDAPVAWPTRAEAG
ncbi:MAG TPA: FAD-dependent oxidoreductase, partial [Alphaproteobacteria bacterium]|nr:FAD-dependent oxidoreductase [Alphaproteobacteria bacterium]